MSERVADDEEAAAYVAQLEDAEDGDDTGLGLDKLRIGSIDDLAAEVERYLRQHRPDG